MCRHTDELFKCCGTRTYQVERCECFKWHNRGHCLLKLRARKASQEATIANKDSAQQASPMDIDTEDTRTSIISSSENSSSSDPSPPRSPLKSTAKKRCSIKLLTCHMKLRFRNSTYCERCLNLFLESETEYRNSGEIQWRKIDWNKGATGALKDEVDYAWYRSKLAPTVVSPHPWEDKSEEMLVEDANLTRKDVDMEMEMEYWGKSHSEEHMKALVCAV